MTHRVFVYGTLKRGYPNNPLLEGSEFLGEAVTVLTYKAVTVPASKMVGTSFPVIMPDPSGKPVAGEIYTVDDATLARLDQLEREGRSYDRVMIDATLPLSNGERLPAQAFIYVGREDRFGEMFARGPLYEQSNERGELDWRAC
jgi:gamma-glutamylaminecyclotransferase